jgi:hypothetical protein
MSLEIERCPACGGRMWQTVLASSSSDPWKDACTTAPAILASPTAPVADVLRATAICLGCGRVDTPPRDSRDTSAPTNRLPVRRTA